MPMQLALPTELSNPLGAGQLRVQVYPVRGKQIKQ